MRGERNGVNICLYFYKAKNSYMYDNFVFV